MARTILEDGSSVWGPDDLPDKDNPVPDPTFGPGVQPPGDGTPSTNETNTTEGKTSTDASKADTDESPGGGAEGKDTKGESQKDERKNDEDKAKKKRTSCTSCGNAAKKAPPKKKKPSPLSRVAQMGRDFAAGAGKGAILGVGAPEAGSLAGTLGTFAGQVAPYLNPATMPYALGRDLAISIYNRDVLGILLTAVPGAMSARQALRAARIAAAERAALARGAKEIDPLIQSIWEVNAGPLGGMPGNRWENCINAAIATDATLGGRAASALPGNLGSPRVLEELFGRMFHGPLSAGELQAAMEAAGPGARGIVIGDVAGRAGEGHVFNIVNDGGVIKFIDGQTGARVSLSEFWRFHLLPTT
jgi:hypothetical protein